MLIVSGGSGSVPKAYCTVKLSPNAHHVGICTAHAQHRHGSSRAGQKPRANLRTHVPLRKRRASAAEVCAVALRVGGGGLCGSPGLSLIHI